MDAWLRSTGGKVIHQIWLDFSLEPEQLFTRKRSSLPPLDQAKSEKVKMPEKYRRFRRSCLKVNADWNQMLWTDEYAAWLLRERYPHFIPTYQGYPHPVQRVDALKYLALYAYGGWYLDMDIECLRPLSEYPLAFPVYFVESANTTIYHTFAASNSLSNSILYSEPGAPLWKHIISELIDRSPDQWYYSKHVFIQMSTGPQFITTMYYTYRDRYKIGTFPKEKFNPCTSCCVECPREKGLYTMHYYDATWNELDSVVLNFLNCYSTLLIGLIMLFFAVATFSRV
jgi:mannosyltransferase OCH1-like enzyme